MKSGMSNKEGMKSDEMGWEKIGVKIGKSVDTDRNVMYNNIRRCGKR